MTTNRLTPADLKVGDVFYECEGGFNVEARVIEAPSQLPDAYDGRTQWQWKAVNTQTGVEIEYRLTEGLEHYGPRIYSAPQYARFDNGEMTFPLYGAALQQENNHAE